MLQLNNIHVDFDGHIVYDQASFCAGWNQLTVITGESGLGKSTLIDVLMFVHQCHYIFENENISKDEAEDFIFHHIGYVAQIPSFIERLTMQEHIRFIMDTFHIESYDHHLLHKLSLDSLLSSFPKQLSQGEKTRFSLFLSLMKTPNILILDEPTASLDQKNKDIIIEVIREYASLNHIVIVSTHDKELIDCADVKYQIIHHQLITNDNINNTLQESNQLLNKDTHHFNKYIRLIKKHNKKSNKFIHYGIGCLLGISLFALSFNNVSLNMISQQMSQSFSNEIIVYKPISNAVGFSFDGIEENMEEDDFQHIQAVEGVKEIKERFDVDLNAALYTIDDSYDPLTEDEAKSIIAYDEELLLEQPDEFNIAPSIHLYYDDMNYSSSIENVYHDKGIYISKDLFDILFLNNDVNDPQIEFYLPVPIYNSDGMTSVPTENLTSDTPSGYVPCNHVTCIYKKVKLPIRGVIKGNVLGQEDSMNNAHIYISENEFSKYVAEAKKMYPDERVVYHIRDGYKTYINQLPKGVHVSNEDQVIHHRKWKTNSYSVFIEDINDLDKVCQDIEKIGYACESRYLNSQAMYLINSSTKDIMLKTSAILLGVGMIFYIFIHFSNRHEEKDTLNYLRTVGFKHQERFAFMIQIWLHHSLNTFLVSFITFYLLKIASEYIMLTLIQPHFSMIIYLLFTSLFVDLVIPLILYKVTQYDSI